VRTTIALFQDRTGEESPPPAASREPAPTVAPRADLWVQVLSLSSRRQAETRSVRLAARGYRVAVLPAQGLKGPVYRVRVGPFETREQAARAAERLSREEGTETWIVPSGQ
jgi:cell division septation protein DedD